MLSVSSTGPMDVASEGVGGSMALSTMFVRADGLAGASFKERQGFDLDQPERDGVYRPPFSLASRLIRMAARLAWRFMLARSTRSAGL